MAVHKLSHKEKKRPTLIDVIEGRFRINDAETVKTDSEPSKTGGVIRIKIDRASVENGKSVLRFKRVAHKEKNAYTIFVAGGSTIDNLVDRANKQISFELAEAK